MILFSEDLKIYGVPLEKSLNVSNLTVSDTGQFSYAIFGDAVYRQKIWRINYSINRGSSVTGVQIAEENLQCNNFSSISCNVPNNTVPLLQYNFGTVLESGNLVNVLISDNESSQLKIKLNFSFGLTNIRKTINFNYQSGIVNSNVIFLPEVAEIDFDSLAYQVEQNMNQIIGSLPCIDLYRRIYSAISPNGNQTLAVRNNTRIAANYDLSFMSLWRNGGEQHLPCVLVTPLHVYSSHVTFGVGETIRWVKNDGTFVDRTVVATIGENGNWLLSRLNAPIFDIQPVKLSPLDLDSYMPSLSRGIRRIPIMCVGRQLDEAYDGGKLLVRDLLTVNSDRYYHVDSELYSNWTWNLEPGDSNNPYFLPVNNEFVLIGTEYYGVGGFAVNGLLSIGTERKTLSEWLVQFGSSGYSIQYADFSLFKKYVI